jgi:hypothetical protein
MILSFLLAISVPAAGSVSDRQFRDTLKIPVSEGSTDRPYKVVGQIKDNLRKPFAFMRDPTNEEIYAEIWERAKKIGADAVINARFSPTRRTLLNHGKTEISGTAIKFVR